MSRPDTQAGHWWQIPLVLGLLGVITVGGGAIASVSDDGTAVETAAGTALVADATSTEARQPSGSDRRRSPPPAPRRRPPPCRSRRRTSERWNRSR